MSHSPDAPITLEREHNRRLIDEMRLHLSTVTGLLEIDDATEGPSARTPEELLGHSTLQLNLPDEGPVIQRTARFRAPHAHPGATAEVELRFVVTHTMWADPTRPAEYRAQLLLGNCFEDSPTVPFAHREEFYDAVDIFVALCASDGADLHPTCA